MEIITEIGTKVYEGDSVEVEGQKIKNPKNKTYI